MAYLLKISDPLGGEEPNLCVSFTTSQTESKKRNKQCPDCSKVFATEYDLFNHRISDCSPNRAISIVKVSAATDLAKTSGAIVVKSEEDGSEYTIVRKPIRRCNGCGYTSKNTYNLNRHKKTCKLLTEEERIAAVATQESNKQDMPKERNHRCDKCDTILQRPENLRRHQQGHNCRANRKTTNIKYFRCRACYKRLMSKEKRDNHELNFCPARNSSRLLTCRGCGSNFTKRFNLTRHQRNNCPALKILTDESVCYVCSDRFQTFDLLKEHLDTKH